jgi:hypothetical protein
MRHEHLAWDDDVAAGPMAFAVVPSCALRAPLARSALAVRGGRPRPGVAAPAGIAIGPHAAAAARPTG